MPGCVAIGEEVIANRSLCEMISLPKLLGFQKLSFHIGVNPRLLKVVMKETGRKQERTRQPS